MVKNLALIQIVCMIFGFFLRKSIQKFSRHLVNDLVKVFLYDIFLLNGDRNLGNIGILESDGKAYLYILDNEFVF